MALWPVKSWSRWDIPDIWEYASAIVGVGCGAWTAVADPGKKTLPAILTAVAGVNTLTAKIVSKWVEKRAKERYAGSLDISVTEAEALNVKSRVFAGAPVLVGGRKWGVLLLDSLKDGFIADTAHKKGLLNRYTELIGRVLTEAGL